MDIGGYEDEKTGRIYPLCKANQDKAIELYKNAAVWDNEIALNHLGKHAYNINEDMDGAV